MNKEEFVEAYPEYKNFVKGISIPCDLMIDGYRNVHIKTGFWCIQTVTCELLEQCEQQIDVARLVSQKITDLFESKLEEMKEEHLGKFYVK